MSRDRVPRRFGIRIRLALLIQAAMLALGVSTAMVASARQRVTMEGELQRRGFAIARDLATFSVRPLLSGDLATLRRLVNHSRSQEHVRSVAVVSPDGTVAMHSDLETVGKPTAEAAWTRYRSTDGPSSWDLPARPGGEPAYGLMVPVTVAGARLGSVVLHYSKAETEREIARARRQILMIGTGAALFAGLLAYGLAVYISRPVTRLADAMRLAARGDVPPRLPATRTDEVGALEASFNAMAADLSAHRRHMEDLVAARTIELVAANTRLESSRQTLRNLAARLQSVRERERTEIAREIHDELGQALTALKMDVHWLGARLAPDAALAEKTRAMSRSIDTTVQAVRRIATELRPKLLDDLGLSAAVEWQAREFERRSGLVCTMTSVPDDVELDGARSTALFRILQEALTNVARHAHATRVDIRLRAASGQVELVVQDDGLGITAEQANAPDALGIVGMRERIAPLGGTLDITGARGDGTTVRVTVPAGKGR